MLSVIKKYLPLSWLSIVRPAYHFLLAFCAALWYGFPARRLTVIGVTGTNGKTSVVELVHEVFAADGRATASLSSLRFKIRDQETPNTTKMTMPGRFFVQRFLYRAARAGCEYAVLEVTSEGIKQFRHRFIRFSVAALTNVSPEHLEAHGGFEAYVRAKLDLFWRLPTNGMAILNQDDALADRFSAATRASVARYGRTLQSAPESGVRIVSGASAEAGGGIEVFGAYFGAQNVSATDAGISFSMSDVEFSSPLLGNFNISNIFCALAIGVSQHVSFEAMARGIKNVHGVAGRVEFVARDPVAVVVDYAHTPDSLRKLYALLRDLYGPSNLVCVLGSAGGGRDTWKRPELGRIADHFCRTIILTNEDPYDEKPAAILKDIERGFSKESKKQSSYKKIIDRKKAIREAIASARPGDVVVISGKGAEPWMMGQSGKKIAWDDREVVRTAFKKMRTSGAKGV